MSEALVSVVIPSFGRPEFLNRAVQSVIEQTWSLIEIIVVDDNGIGTDNQIQSARVIADIRTSHRIHYITNTSNRGGGFTRNAGVSAAKGKFIAFLDDDDEWLPNFLAAGVKALEAVPADVVYCDCFIVEDGIQTSIKLEENRKFSGNVWPQLISGWCPSSTSLFILRRSVIKNRQLFDDSLSSFQDYDCWMSLAKSSRFTYHTEPSVIKHSHRSGQITTNTTARRTALEVLRSKWIPKLKSDELIQFEQAIGHLAKDILRMEYKIAMQNKSWRAAAGHAFRFIRSAKLSWRDLYTLLKNSK